MLGSAVARWPGRRFRAAWASWHRAQQALLPARVQEERQQHLRKLRSQRVDQGGGRSARRERLLRTLLSSNGNCLHLRTAGVGGSEPCNRVGGLVTRKAEA